MGTENDQLTNLLTILLAVLLIVLLVLVIVYVVLLTKKNKKESKSKKSELKKNQNDEYKNSVQNNQQSVLNFMEFDEIQDNMIIQKENSKYIMVVECQGVNYDLMSEVEKTGVEQGFLQFLNSLRHPIQLYVQTRTIDLGSSIASYRQRVDQIELELKKKKQQYEDMIESRRYTERDKQRLIFDITKQTNLYEYGRDVIADTERMSLNRNILSKKYYVVIPYYPSDLGANEFDDAEVRNIAFSELYTRAQAVIRTLSACDVKGKILNTKELVELLYIAYNRDQAEDFGINKAISAQYDKLYSTSEDIFEKRMRELDKEIETKAVEKAVSKVEKLRTKKEQEAAEKERQMDQLIEEMAKMIIEGNKKYIGKDIAEEAINELEGKSNGSTKKEVEVDAKEKTRKKTTRTRKQTSK